MFLVNGIVNQTAVMVSKNRSAQIYIAALLCVVTYLVLKLSLDPTFYLNSSDLIQQLGIALLIGLAVYLGIVGFYCYWDRLKNKWIEKIGPLELFKVCNDATKKFQTEISQILSSSNSVDETSQSLFIGRQAECFAYVYGLVLIGMCNYDQTFLQSDKYTQLNSRVLQRLINISKEKYSSMSVDMDLVEMQLRKTKCKELEKIMTGIEFYNYQINANQKNPLTKLVKIFGKQTSLEGKNNFRQLILASNRILDEVDTLVQEYKK